MERVEENQGLKQFFQKLTLLCFQQLLIDNRVVADYVSSLLTRFARTSQVYRIKNSRGEKLEYIVDLLAEAHSALDLANDRFSPFRERDVRKHIGDYTLFMTGIFRNTVTKNASLQYYMDQGKRSYSSVSEFDRLAEKGGAHLFEDLAIRFEDYSWALDYMKKVYFQDPSLASPYGSVIQDLTAW